MMLGAFAFESLGFGYQDVGRRTETPWADIPVSATLNKQQWTGPTSDEITIKGVLFPKEFGGLAELEGIRSAQMAGAPMMFVSGDAGEGVIHGTFTVQSISEDRSLHDARGTPVKNAYQITLKRYDDAMAGMGGSNPFARISNILWGS